MRQARLMGKAVTMLGLVLVLAMGGELGHRAWAQPGRDRRDAAGRTPPAPPKPPEKAEKPTPPPVKPPERIDKPSPAPARPAERPESGRKEEPAKKAGDAKAADAAEAAVEPKKPSLPPTVLSATFEPYLEPRPRRFVLNTAALDPAIDGRLKEACWSGTTYLLGDMVDDTTGRNARRVTRVYVVRCGERLCLGFYCKDPDIHEISPARQILVTMWPRDGVYVMLDADRGKPLILAVGADGSRVDSAAVWGEETRPEWTSGVFLHEEGWSVEIAINLASLGPVAPKPGARWRLNVGRKSSRIQEFSVWAPTFGDFRSLKSAGQLVFAGEGIAEPAASLGAPGIEAFLDRNVYAASDCVAEAAVRVRGLDPRSPARWQVHAAFERPQTGVEETGVPLIAASVFDVSEEFATFKINLAVLPAGKHALALDLRGEANQSLAKKSLPFEKRESADETPQRGLIPLRVALTSEHLGRLKHPSWPVRGAVAFPRGAVFDVRSIRLLDPRGEDVPCQTRPLAWWGSEGSIKWAALDFAAYVSTGVQSVYQVEYVPDIRRREAAGRKGIQCWDVEGVVVVNAGDVMFNVDRGRFLGIQDAWVDANGDDTFSYDEQIIWSAGRASGPYLVDEEGRRYLAALDPDVRVVVEEQGPLRACVRAEGWFYREASALPKAATAKAADGAPAPDAKVERPEAETSAGPARLATDGVRLGRFVTRIMAYHGQPFVRVQQTFVLTHDSSLVRLRDLGVIQYLDLDRESRMYTLGSDPPVTTPAESSALRVVQYGDKAFRVTGLKEGAAALKTPPAWFSIHSSRQVQLRKQDVTLRKGLSVFVRDVARLWPKEVECHPDGRFVVHAWPAHWEGVPEPPKLSADNLGDLAFCHYGPKLDFVPPAKEYEAFLKLPDKAGIEAAVKANSMGVAVTLDMLYFFHSHHTTPADVAKIHQVFLASPYASPDPESLARAGVLSLPAGADAAQADRLREAVWAGLAAREAERPASGMFNDGAFRRIAALGKRPSLADYRVGTSNDLGAVLWSHCLSTGRADLRDIALRHTRLMADASVCHYAGGSLATHQDEAARKVHGGFARPHSFVPWLSANGVTRSWSRAEFLAAAWRVEGMPRAWDALNAWMEAVRRVEAMPEGDDGLATLASLCSAYEVSPRGFLMDRMRRAAAAVLKGSPSGLDARLYCDGLLRYYLATSDAEAAEFLGKLAERFGGAADASTNALYLPVFMDAYRATGKPEHLALAQRLASHFEQGEGVKLLDKLDWAAAVALFKAYPACLAARSAAGPKPAEASP